MADLERLLVNLAVAHATREPAKVEAAMKPILDCKVSSAAVILSLLDIQARTEAAVREATLHALQRPMADTVLSGAVA